MKNLTIAASLGLVACFLSMTVSSSEIRDPSQPLGSIKSSEKTLKSNVQLQSILFSDSRKLAVIDQQMLTENQRYADIVVTKIYRDRVIIKRNGKREVLKLSRDIKKEASE